MTRLLAVPMFALAGLIFCIPFIFVRAASEFALSIPDKVFIVCVCTILGSLGCFALFGAVCTALWGWDTE